VALFKRGKVDRSRAVEPELSTILLEGEDMIEQVGRAHRERWGLGSADSWNLDQTTGSIRWIFPDKTVEAPAQILGSHNSAAGSWLWAWANETILANLRHDAERVRAWAETNGHTSLLQPKVEANDEVAASFAAIAVRVTEATGFYRAPVGASKVFLTFGPVTIITAAGDSTTFTIGVGE
jgi:hypothetical protein